MCSIVSHVLSLRPNSLQRGYRKSMVHEKASGMTKYRKMSLSLRNTSLQPLYELKPSAKFIRNFMERMLTQNKKYSGETSPPMMLFLYWIASWTRDSQSILFKLSVKISTLIDCHQRASPVRLTAQMHISVEFYRPFLKSDIGCQQNFR